MIVVRLQGGLGNQMFQYAAGRRLAEHHETTLYLDTSAYGLVKEGETPRTYELECFQIQASTDLPSSSQTPLSPRKRLARMLDYRAQPQALIINESQASLQAVLEAPDNTTLVGYWQNPSFFADIRPALLDEFTPKAAAAPANVEALAAIESLEAVSLHVRRGDYVTNIQAHQYHGVAGLDYYTAAIDEVKKVARNPRFFVFSDDISWCRDNLGMASDTVYIDHNSGREAYWDLVLMSRCQHNIIANSSFSWWGAWLNRNENKVVVAPERWFSDPSMDTSTLIPPSWKRL